MSERFDIFDENLRRIGVKSREAVHRDGDWHQVFHCWIVGRDRDGEAFALLQKRGPAQDTYPGKLDISAAGHLEAGETVRDGVREIEEELGLRVDFDQLVPLGRRLGVMKCGDIVDRQICHVFLYECDRALDDYRYSRDEVAGLLKLRLDAGIRLLAGECDRVQVEAVGLDAARLEISADEFIPSLDNYTLKVLLLAKRYFAGDRQLWV